MCGIAGVFGAREPEMVQAMLGKLHHRGPDDEGIYTDERVSLGHRRLAIIDTSSGGHQPMSAANGRIQIVYNGEIYNFRSERSALEAKGWRFRSQSDTEVILALYQQYGDAFLPRLRGIFSLALYDEREGPGAERLVLARDHFGIKPLLYAEKGGILVFASELKALLASGQVSREVDPVGLRLLLSLGSVYQPQTLIRDVKALPSGHYLVVDASGTHLRRYWSYATDRIEGLRSLPYAEQVNALRKVMTDSVRLQMLADVPVGAFLSSGVDSSLIVALMARESNVRVKTFSVGFECGASAVDESRDTEEIANLLGTSHLRVMVGGAEVAAHVQRFITGLDQPSVDGLNSYFVSYAASQAATVALSGTGGDEVFLGYPWFAHIERQFGTAPLYGGAIRDNEGAGARFRDAFGSLYHCFGPDEAESLMSDLHRTGAPRRSFAEDLDGADELREAGALDRASVLCLNGYTRNQLLRDIDACSMVHSLEVRVPFLDPVVADFALSVPSDAKLVVTDETLKPGASYNGSGVKRIVCDVARSYLPEEFFAKRAKKGFLLPHEDWLRGPLAELLRDTLSPETVKRAGLFDPSAAANVYEGFLSGKRPWSHPWLLMISELWRRQVLAA
jgi:asparagine synthase (glutamine-hydrolysing)